MLENFKSPHLGTLFVNHTRARSTPSSHARKSLRLAHPLVATMYGGYDGSASQFAGQGGFLPTPAGGATAGADAGAGGAVSARRSDDDARARTNRRLDASPSARARRRDPGRARAESTRGASSGRSVSPPAPLSKSWHPLIRPPHAASSPRCPALPERPAAWSESRGVARAPHREADRGGRQRDQRGASRARDTPRPRRARVGSRPLPPRLVFKSAPPSRDRVRDRENLRPGDRVRI